MADWIARFDDILRLSERDILTHAGKILLETAVEKAPVQKAKSEFEAQAALPRPVDEHFEHSLDELKQIETQRPPPTKKKTKKKPIKKKPKRPRSGEDS
ncbi:MAG TPA: hypothetical protein VND64_13580 [Pirellulales bacterium]|nr:hypothetical protein [Pirellulales bacterium]